MENLQCWKCGASLDEPLPLARTATCHACNADLHVCKMCRLYDTSVAKACREPIADEVRDKERANFCGYLELIGDAHRAGGAGSQQARDELASLFGLDAAPAAPDSAEEAKRKLEDLFKKD